MGLNAGFICGGRGVLPGVGSVLIQRQRRWAGIETTVGRRPVFTVCFVCPLSTMRWPFVGAILDSATVV